MDRQPLDRLRKQVIQRLESLQRAGVLQIAGVSPRTLDAAARMAGAALGRGETARRGGATGDATGDATLAFDAKVGEPSPDLGATLSQSHDKEVRKMASQDRSATIARAREPDASPPDLREVNTAPTLEILQREVASCIRCPELASTRTQTVFGVGNPDAELCFLGEAPGADEDRTGIPFVGRAGQLLTDIIKASKLTREDVYILNMIKCRPPANRNPLPQELANCRHFLDRQLELIGPKYICCLGAVAAQNLLATQVPIGRLRGKIHDYRGIKVVCTYHPAYLLRNPGAKRHTWEDMKMLMREMGIEL